MPYVKSYAKNNPKRIDPNALQLAPDALAVEEEAVLLKRGLRDIEK